jgi:hypothetical protein
MKRVKQVSILIAILSLLMTPDATLACCGGTLSSPDAYVSASDVFICKVVEIFQPPPEMTHNSDGSVSVSESTKPGFVRLSVEKSYKGNQGTEVQLPLNRTSGGYWFEVGEEYLVYADREDGKLSTGKCRRTRPLSRATSDIKYLEALQQGEPQATIYGYVLREVFDQEGKMGLQTPFEEFMVIAKSEDLRVEVLAEKSGEYEIALPPGKYEVWVERVGVIVSRSTEVVTLKDHEGNQKNPVVRLN